MAAFALIAPCHAAGKLPNGLSIVPVERRAADVCAVHIALDIGIERVPPQKPGLGSLIQQALLAHMKRELEKRPELAAMRAAEGEGPSLSVQASWDDVEFLGQVTSRDLPGLLRFLADTVFGAELTQDDIVDAKEVLAGAEGGAPGEDQPALTVYYLFRRALIGDSPLSQPLYPPDASRPDFTLADVRGFYKTYYVPNLASVCVVAPMSVAEITKAVTGAFGALKAREVAPAPQLQAAAGESRVIPGTSAGAGGAILMVGVPLPPLSSDGYPLGLMLHAALSGPKGTLALDKTLNTGLPHQPGRDMEEGLFPSHVDMVPVPLSRAPYLAALAACSPREVEETRQGLLGHLLALADEPLSDEALRRARLRAMNLHAADLAAPAALAAYTNRCHLLGAPHAGEEDLAIRIAAVTANDLQEFAKAQFTRHAIGLLLPGA